MKTNKESPVIRVCRVRSVVSLSDDPQNLTWCYRITVEDVNSGRRRIVYRCSIDGGTLRKPKASVPQWLWARARRLALDMHRTIFGRIVDELTAAPLSKQCSTCHRLYQVYPTETFDAGPDDTQDLLVFNEL